MSSNVLWLHGWSDRKLLCCQFMNDESRSNSLKTETMNPKQNLFRKMALAALGISGMILTAGAQPFAYQQNDLLVGFRKTGTFQANYEVVVDIGQGSNYVGLAAGASVSVPNFSSNQLADAFANFNNLNWSVLGDPNSTLAGYPSKTLWLTVPRSDVNTQTDPPDRQNQGGQQIVAVRILGIFQGAASISRTIGTSNQDNNVTLVREPINNNQNLSAFISDTGDTSQSDFNGNWSQNVEITTPSSFSSGVRSDLYEVRPTGVLDPHTGQTSGSAYYVGYFQFNPNGTMTFTRASAGQPPPPPQPQLSISRSGNTSTITFGTTNAAV